MPDSQVSLVQLDHVDYEQNGVEILRDVSWTLAAGEHWAILGPNGSGKSTLLKIACGYLWPTGGRVLRQGRELLDLREWRKQVGWISNELVAQVPRGDTAVETVVTGRTSQVGLRYLPHFKPAADEFDEARQKLHALGCDSLVDKPFGVLSQGERQQVLIARAQMAGPMLLVLDEPCAGMDPGVRERFLAWLNARLTPGAARFSEPGVSALTDPTVLLVTHHVEEVMPGITRTLMMAAGRIHDSGTTPDVVTQPAIEAVYGTQLARLEISGDRRWPIWNG